MGNITPAPEPLVHVAAKVPADLKDRFTDLAYRRRTTVSALLRVLIERELEDEL